MTVAVVGGGLAGSMAALAAAGHRDRRVLLATEDATSLHGASGLVDVLGYTPAGDGPLTDPLAAVPNLPADHPYTTVGVDGIREGLSVFDDVTGDAYAGDGDERNALVPTALGQLKPTARYPVSVSPGVASRRADTVLVGFETLPAFDAPVAARRLDDTLPYHVYGATVRFPHEFDEAVEADAFAATLEADEPADRGAVPDSTRESLAHVVAEHAAGRRRVGLPAVLGWGSVGAVRTTVRAAANAHVFEVPMGEPSVPGRRLQDGLRRALATAGVEVHEDKRVVEPVVTDGRIESLRVSAETEPLVVEDVVLATGGLVGGGFGTDRRDLREPVFDCRVAHPPDRYEWFDDDALGRHPFARFGVATDAFLRPVDGRGDPEYENLHAAGGVLAGYNFPAEKSGGGVSVATGVRAGRLAAE